MIKTINICDRCGKQEITNGCQPQYPLVKGGELCPQCYDAYQKFLEQQDREKVDWLNGKI